eukprot:304235-Pelagomonas_calceolata.AAC.4
MLEGKGSKVPKRTSINTLLHQPPTTSARRRCRPLNLGRQAKKKNIHNLIPGLLRRRIGASPIAIPLPKLGATFLTPLPQPQPSPPPPPPPPCASIASCVKDSIFLKDRSKWAEMHMTTCK